MEEELSENELEERSYSSLHYTDHTQENLKVNNKNVPVIVDTAPRSTIRRYWHTSEQHSVYSKVNTPKVPPASKNAVTEKTDSKPKPQKCDIVPSPPSTTLLSMFQSPISQNLKKTIEIIENDDENHQIVALESSDDDDEVIEVALPPKTTITIDSSDEDEVCAINEVKPKDVKENISPGKKNLSDERDVSASPVPSVVSSVSDEFIRGDCIALNISSRYPSNQSFDFSLHGSDLLVQTPTKRKRKKKNKDANTSTPIVSTPTTNIQQSNTPTSINKEECFATPKSKAKNKRQKSKSYLVSAKSLPNPDVYDSDSNQSVTEINKIPSNSEDNGITVNETTSTPSEIPKSKETTPIVNTELPEKNMSKDKHDDVSQKIPKENEPRVIEATDIVDLTDTSDQDMSLISIDENIVMGNVSGFPELEEYNASLSSGDAPKFGSTKVPEILYADLDFNNLNGKERASKRRRYSLTTLRAEMEKFYNESWGGENFNHREIQKYMSRDKSLWVIDPKDKFSAFHKRKVTCNYCNRQGHRDDTCRLKPPVCYMCGSMGHKEPRCPRKICVNCGSPNHMYTSMCRNCYHWHGITCAECGQSGHPPSHCPDLWRRYHNTISEDTPLEENHQLKKNNQMFCSGCTKRGHLIHSCRNTVPFSDLPINSPYVTLYEPIYPATNVPETTVPTSQPRTTPQHKNNQRDDTCESIPHKSDRNKRQSKSPVVHETHVNKKRNLSGNELTYTRVHTKSPVNNGQKRKTSQNKDVVEDDQSCSTDSIICDTKTTAIDPEKAPDFIPLCSGNHDKQGQIIQDNEVSDTSDFVNTARIYITGEILDKLNTTEGLDWLNKTASKNSITIQKTDIISFLVIKGTVGNQEAFQAELKEWIKNELNVEFAKCDQIGDSSLENDQSLAVNIPKNRYYVLQVISKALNSLRNEIGDPKALFKEFTYLQNRHIELLSQKVISPKQLSISRTKINSILKKLNMVLLGQAGLADGPTHLNELCALHKKITYYRQKIIPIQLRQAVGHHIRSIFTATPRDDYADLIRKYYISKNTQIISKNNNIRRSNINLKGRRNKDINNLKNIKQNSANTRIDLMSNGVLNFKKPLIEGSRFVKKTVDKLIFYHKRLSNTQPVDAVLKKTKTALMNQLHYYISSLSETINMSPKTLKKTRQIQEQAQLFLTNV